MRERSAQRLLWEIHLEPFDGRATEAFDVAIGKDIVEIEIVEGN